MLAEWQTGDPDHTSPLGAIQAVYMPFVQACLSEYLW